MLNAATKKNIKALLIQKMMKDLQKDLYSYLAKSGVDTTHIHSTEVHPISGSPNEFHIVIKLSHGMEYFHVKISNPL